MPQIEDADLKAQLREEQGEAYQKAVEYLRDNHVDAFERKKVGDYIISVACEEAEGMYRQGTDGLTWDAPDADLNQHLEVIVQDADDLRFVPELKIKATIENESREVVAELQPSFLWHPYASHYGQNFSIPASGKYKIRVSFEAPIFGRHDELLGKRFRDSIDMTFGPLSLTPERELHGPE